MGPCRLNCSRSMSSARLGRDALVFATRRPKTRRKPRNGRVSRQDFDCNIPSSSTRSE